MIHSLKVKNFLSFRDEVTLSFEATRDKHLEEYHVVEVAPGVRLSKLGIIYGANASGKTNMITAFNLLPKFWFNTPGNKDISTEIVPFLLDDVSENQPSEFTLTFYVNEKKIVYSLHATSSTVIHESLYYYSSVKPTEVFLREFRNNVSEIQFNPKLKLGNVAEKEITIKCLSNMSVIAAYNQVNVHNEIMDSIVDWMKNKILPAIGPWSNLTKFAKSGIVSDEKMKAYVINLLKEADFNIDNIQTYQIDQPVSADLFIEFNQSGQVSFKEKDPDSKEKSVKYTGIAFSHRVVDDKGNSSIHTLPDLLQSNGTIRTMGLASAISKTLEQDAFIPIDEIEASLHPRLVEFLIESFLKQSEHAQMLLTTHYDGLLEQEDLLRTDNIWFTRKKSDGSTELYSLSDFTGLGRISSLQKAYKYGKFGAVPNI